MLASFATRFPLRAAWVGAVLSSSLLPGCAPVDEDDDPVQLGTEVSESSGRCRPEIDGRHYSFASGRFRVCWGAAYGPYGSAVHRYYLRNASGQRRRLKIALNNMPDTHCQWINNGAEGYFRINGYRFSGQPQRVVACD